MVIIFYLLSAFQSGLCASLLIEWILKDRQSSWRCHRLVALGMVISPFLVRGYLAPVVEMGVAWPLLWLASGCVLAGLSVRQVQLLWKKQRKRPAALPL
jgi:hypothetical protein